MSEKDFTEDILPAIEDELRRQIGRLDQPDTISFYEMLVYHMGWPSRHERQPIAGKRIRPLVLLLVTAATGFDWRKALPASAAVEIVHNFSLVHDDIQDNSPERHGRPAAWKRFGSPMAINVGDALFAISSLAMVDLTHHFPADTVLRASTILHNACLALTRGQFLDMSYEKRTDLAVDDYWPMIEGKTSALIAACTEIGALLGGASTSTIEGYRVFGRDLGLAFQVQDDILGIWGDENLTGKSASSDLVEGKNSLPILYGLNRNGEFARRWAAEAVRPEEVAEVAQMLRDEGAWDYAQAEAERLTKQALQALEKAGPGGSAGAVLTQLTGKLLKRNS